MSDLENKPLANGDLVNAFNEATTVPQFMEVARAAKKGSPIEREALSEARDCAGNDEEWKLIRDHYPEGSVGWDYANRVMETCMERDK